MKRLKLKFSILVVLVIGVFTVASGQKTRPGLSDASAVLKVMMLQQNAWNKGNLEGFMAGYWKNDSLLFIGKRGPSYGWEPVFKNYKKSYPDAEAMGTLQFQKLDIRMLSPRNAWVMGRWELTRKDKSLGGWFTLLVEKKAGQWVIVADHTSSDPE